MRRSGNDQSDRSEEGDQQRIQLKHATIRRRGESPDADRGEARRNSRRDEERHPDKECGEKIASESIECGESLCRDELLEQSRGIDPEQVEKRNKLFAQLRRRTCTEERPARVGCNEREIDETPDHHRANEEEEQRKERIRDRCHHQQCAPDARSGHSPPLYG